MNTTYTVTSLGRKVTYSPTELFETLRFRFPEFGTNAEDADVHNKRIVMHLYRRLGLPADMSTAGGVVQLVFAGRHVSAIVLNEFFRNMVKNE